MARNRLSDLLQSYPFWLLDISPSARPPFVVLGGPLYGFSQITHPELVAEVEEVRQWNTYYKPRNYVGADVTVVTLFRGTRFYDSSFYTWLDRSIAGEDVPARNLLLIQFMGANAGFGGDLPAPITPDLVEVIRIPGKAWILWEAIPIRYKTGSDLEAASGEVSVAELDIQTTRIDEFSLDPVRIADAGLG